MNKTFIADIQNVLEKNSGKLSPLFIIGLAKSGNIQYLHPTPTMRLCIITIPSGHEVLGVAQVLEPNNDVEEIGNKVAYDNAISELWKTIGSIAKVVQ